MSTDELIHHYTTINNLALILKNRTIRFSRLDKLDDISETFKVDPVHVYKYLFVSCWTYMSEESIPQWHMYTDRMRGVRISFPKDWRYMRPVQPRFRGHIEKQGEFLSPIPFDRMFNDNYFIIPSYLDISKFGGNVTYVDDINLQYEKYVKLTDNADGTTELNIMTEQLGFFKKKDWEFQKEYRFVLFIMPSIPLGPDGVFSEEFSRQLPGHLMHCLRSGIGPDMNYFDMDINPEVINHIHITLGPLCTESEKIMVESLVKEYTTNGTVRESQFARMIRHHQGC